MWVRHERAGNRARAQSEVPTLLLLELMGNMSRDRVWEGGRLAKCLASGCGKQRTLPAQRRSQLLGVPRTREVTWVPSQSWLESCGLPRNTQKLVQVLTR